MRDLDQGYEIDVILDRPAVVRGDTPAISAAFDATYRLLFGRTEVDVAHEVVSWRLGVHGPRPQIELAAAPVKRHRMAWFREAGGYVQTAVYDRYTFGPGSSAAGPALFEERESTVVVPPGACVQCDESLNLIIDF